MNGKAVGEDSILAQTLKETAETLVHELEMLFNKCLADGEIPELSNVVVVLIYKKEDKH